MSEKVVLIIEDNPTNRKIMRDILSVNHFQYLEAENGELGVQMALEHQPDLILMDVQLPIIDGYEATQRLKADVKTKHIPVVAVTSFAMSGEEERARLAGCDAYIAKPFDIHQVIATVKSFLD